IYLLIQIVCIGTLPDLAHSQRPIADAATRFLGHAGASIISAGIVISIFGNLHITLLSAARVPFAMADCGQAPRFLGVTHPRFPTPLSAFVLPAAVVLIMALSGTFIYAATISTLARLVGYMATCAALPVLRRKKDLPAAGIRIPGGVALASAAVLLSLWL